MVQPRNVGESRGADRDQYGYGFIGAATTLTRRSLWNQIEKGRVDIEPLADTHPAPYLDVMTNQHDTVSTGSARRYTVERELARAAWRPSISPWTPGDGGRKT